MPQRNKQSFLHGALILTAAAVVTKVIGALFFKIPLQKINDTAYGYFEAAYNIYIPLYIVSTAGFPIAVSRMVSKSLALGRYRDVRVIRLVANRVFWVTGLAGTLLMAAAAFFYPQYIDMPNMKLTMLIMAPSILFCCLMTCYRGVYEGSRNMLPTAMTQIVEAVGKIVFGISLAAGALRLGQWQFERGLKVFGRHAESAQHALEISLPYIAAGGMVGVTAGSFFSLLYIFLKYRADGSGIAREELASAPPPQSHRTVLRSLLRFAFPVAIGTLATQLTSIIDVVSLQKCLAVVIERDGDIVREIYQKAIAQSGTTDVLAFLTGGRGIAMTYVNLVPNITLTFAISALPVITTAWTLRDREGLQNMTGAVLRITFLISLPAGLGFTVLAKPIMRFIYDPAAAEVAGSQLEVLGLAAVFICLVAPINSMLQAMGRADIPAKIVLVGGAVKLGLNILLILNPRINIMGSAYSTLVCYAVMVILSLYGLRRVMRTRIRWRSVFIRPAPAALCSAAAAWGAHRLFSLILSERIAVLSAILIAVIVYVWILLSAKAILKEDILMLPKGQKIAKILAKYKWIG